MPKHKAHLSAGFILFILSLFLLQILSASTKINISIYQAILYLSFCLLGSLFPDIDITSKIQKILYYFLFVGIIISIALKKWTALSIISIISFIPLLSEHRHLTHSMLFLTMAPLIILFATISYQNFFLSYAISCYLFFVLGAISHLILDFWL